MKHLYASAQSLKITDSPFRALTPHKSLVISQVHQIEQNDVLLTKGALNQGNRAPKEEIHEEGCSNV